MPSSFEDPLKLFQEVLRKSKDDMASKLLYKSYALTARISGIINVPLLKDREVRKEDALKRIEKERQLVDIINKRKRNWIGHFLRRYNIEYH